MAARDFEMGDRARAPLPARVERLIDPTNPLREFFDSIPGFHTEMNVVEKKDEARYVELQKLVAATELLKSKYPQYDYCMEEVKARSARRQAIDSKIFTEEHKFRTKMDALQKVHLQTMRNLRRDKQLMVQLAQIDDNLLIIDKEMEESNKALNASAYKEARKQRLAAAREAREEAYAETLAMQDARRRGETKRRKSNARVSPIPELEADQPVEEEVQNEYDASYAAASA